MVNAGLIEKIAAVKSAHDVIGALDGESLVEGVLDVIEFIWSGEYKVIAFASLLSLSFIAS